MNSLCILVVAALTYVQGKPSSAVFDVPCGDKGVAKYNLTFDAFWTEARFYKQFPTFRPHAQWSKLVGRTHSNYYRLWEEDTLCSAGVMEYAELGTTETLDLETQGHAGILDIFNTENLNLGVGTTSVKVIADPFHSKLSLMAKLLPSPDWFVGVDSLELCKDGEWVDRLVYDLPPYDAGTDRGFTFTAPNWPEVPYKEIYKITSKMPNHPANSFFYPEWNELPTIATLTLVKVDTIEMDMDINYKGKDAETLNDDDRSRPVPKTYRPQEQPIFNHGMVIQDSNNIAIKNTAEKKPEFSMFRTDMKPKSYTPRPEQATPAPQEDREYEIRRQRKPKKAEQSIGFPRSCEVTEWQEWSACSKTCGYGTHMRTRMQLRAPENGGAPCPVLKEEKLCGSMRSCTWTHFNSFGSRPSSRPNRRRKPRRKSKTQEGYQRRMRI